MAADGLLRSVADALPKLYAAHFAQQPTALSGFELKCERVRNLGTDERALAARFEEALALLEQAPSESAN